MQNNVYEIAKKYLSSHKKWKVWQKVVTSLACVVVFCTVYALILPALTEKTQTSCGCEEHTHAESCYENALICENSTEVEIHAHTEECLLSEKMLICELEETEEHLHGEECYVEESSYICGMEEGQELAVHEHTDECYEALLICEVEEHVHTLVCYSNPAADVENEEIWKRTFSGVKFTGDWSEDFVAIAESQLGYKESKENYIVDEDGETIHGYTRFGDWYGNTYGEWCAMYVSFCLNYANIEGMPLESGCQNWINKLREEPYNCYYDAEEYIPTKGDLIFFNLDALSDSDHVGVVVEYVPATENESAKVKTIEGNSYREVRHQTYSADDSTIMGYGQLPMEPKATIEEEVAETLPGELKEITLTAVIYNNDKYKLVTEDDTVITMTGRLPEDAVVKAYPVELEVEGQKVFYAYDITIFLPDGSIYEPTEGDSITVKISSPEFTQAEEEAEPGMYYIPEEGEPEPIGSTIEEDGVSFTAEHFSVYALMAPEDASKVETRREFRTAINNGEKYIQLNADIEINHDYSLVVPANTEITIDLNGYTLKHTGTAALFDIKDGATLIIGDSRVPTESVVQESGNLYGREASLTVGSDNYATLTYYVTKSVVTNSNLGETAESVEKHTVTTRGAIVGNDYPVFNISSGTLNIDSGMVRSGSARAIKQTGGIVNVTGGYICGFNQPYDDSEYSYGQPLKYSANDFGGAIHSTGGELNISSTGVLAANTAACGGAVYVGNDTVMNIAGGYISGNKALYHCSGWKGESDVACVGGGGIVANGTINMTGGYITHNIAVGGQYFDGGGGVLLKTGSSMTVNGGYLTGNQAQGGGAIKSTFRGAIEFTMNGGHVSANVATTAEGGGLSIDRNGVATINAGYITNNILQETVHWGGGGLFCADGATMYLTRALITENSAGGFGGGVAGCPTGHLYLYVTEGCAVYDNSDIVKFGSDQDNNPNFVNGGTKNDIDKERCTELFQAHGHSDFFCALNSTVTNAMLGGSFSNWEGSADQQIVVADKDEIDILSATEVMGLEAHPSDAGKLAAQQDAALYINGNYSYTHGGGIMCNGNLVVGIPEDVEIPVRLEIQGTKGFTNNAGSPLSLKDNNFLFTVTDATGKEIAEGRCDENGKITFNNQIVLKQEGTFVYEIKEKIPENADSDIQYDSTKYRLTVVVKKDNGIQWYGETWKYTYEITSLKVTRQNGNGTEQEISVNTKTQSGVITVLPVDQEQISFTNIQTEFIEMKVIKNWVGKTPDVDSITVKLYCNDEVIDTKILNDANDWKHSWTSLPTKDDSGNAYNYRVEEEHVDGYLTTYEETNETAIHTTNITNTNINDAKFNLDMIKVSKEDPEVTLEGAEFELINDKNEKLYFVGENGVYTVSDSDKEGATTKVITVKGGKLLLNEIPAGTYTLRETKAPEGYDVIKDEKITLDEFSEVTIKLTVEDPEKAYVIPETGGIGTNWFIVGGIMLMIASLLYGYKMLRQRERGMS